MPRKQKNILTDTKKNKKTLLNTLVKNMQAKDEHIILKLPLTQQHIDKITNNETNLDFTNEPLPYEKKCCYLNETLSSMTNNSYNTNNVNECKDVSCYWCCHKIDYKVFGMPLNYDSVNDTFSLYGSFCSLQCANAYNFSTYNGCDKVWEINAMIQMLGKRYGFINYIRPAPSKYLLKMFDGYLTIDEFRNLHKTNENTHILNLPPMISILSTYEVVNTSYIKKT